MNLVTWPSSRFPCRGGYDSGYAAPALGSSVPAGCNIYLWHILQALNLRRNIIRLNVPANQRANLPHGIAAGDDDFQPYPDWCAKLKFGIGAGQRALVTDFPSLLNWFRLEIEKCGLFFALVKQELNPRGADYADPDAPPLWTGLGKMSVASAAARLSADYGVNLAAGADAGLGTPPFGNSACHGWLVNRMTSAGYFADIARPNDGWKQATDDVMLFWAQFVNEMMHYINMQRVLYLNEITCDFWRGDGEFMLDEYDDPPSPVKTRHVAQQAYNAAVDNLARDGTTSSYVFGDIGVTAHGGFQDTPYRGFCGITAYLPRDYEWKYLISQRDRIDLPIYEHAVGFLNKQQLTDLISGGFSSLRERDTYSWGLVFSSEIIAKKFDPLYRDADFNFIHFA
jgi:hypothetical protein